MASCRPGPINPDWRVRPPLIWGPADCELEPWPSIFWPCSCFSSYTGPCCDWGPNHLLLRCQGGPAAARPPSLVLQGLVTKINFILTDVPKWGNCCEGGCQPKAGPGPSYGPGEMLSFLSAQNRGVIIRLDAELGNLRRPEAMKT